MLWNSQHHIGQNLETKIYDSKIVHVSHEYNPSTFQNYSKAALDALSGKNSKLLNSNRKYNPLLGFWGGGGANLLRKITAKTKNILSVPRYQ